MAIKLLFLAGSARQESVNKKLSKHAFSLAKKEDVEATFIDLKDYPMPVYDGDWEEENGLPEKTIALKKLFCDCDGFFIASPEYNSGYSALLKNTVDWLSRTHEEGEKPLMAFSGKIAAISAASPGGLGGLRGLVPLRMLLGNIGVTVIPSQAALSGAMKSFDDQGKLVNEQQAGMIEKVVKELIKTTSALK